MRLIDDHDGPVVREQVSERALHFADVARPQMRLRVQILLLDLLEEWGIADG